MATKYPKGALPTNFTLSNPSGKYHNGAETKVNTNFTPDPELVYRGGIPDDNLIHNSDGFVADEFMNNEDQAKSKDYAVYAELTAEQRDTVDEAIKYSWDASELASADRPMLSEWDNQEATATDADETDGVLDRQGVWTDYNLDDDILKDSANGVNTLSAEVVFLDNVWTSTKTSTGSYFTLRDDSNRGGAASWIGEFLQDHFYKISFDIRIDASASQPYITIRERGGSDDVGKRYTSLFNQHGDLRGAGWKTFEYITVNSQYDYFRLYPSADGQGASNSAIGDIAEIKNIVISQHSGNNFGQGAKALKPALSDAGTKDALITYNGVDQFMSQPVTSDNFQDLTRFEYWCIARNDGNSNYNMNFADSGNSSDQILMYSSNSNEFTLLVYNNSGTVNSVSAPTSSGYHVIGVIFDGVEYKIYVDNVLAILSESGTNNGKFIGDFTNKINYDKLNIALYDRGSPVYNANYQKYDLMFGGTTDAALSTAAERTNIFNMINKKADLGL